MKKIAVFALLATTTVACGSAPESTEAYGTVYVPDPHPAAPHADGETQGAINAGTSPDETFESSTPPSSEGKPLSCRVLQTVDFGESERAQVLGSPTGFLTVWKEGAEENAQFSLMDRDGATRATAAPLPNSTGLAFGLLGSEAGFILSSDEWTGSGYRRYVHRIGASGSTIGSTLVMQSGPAFTDGFFDGTGAIAAVRTPKGDLVGASWWYDYPRDWMDTCSVYRTPLLADGTSGTARSYIQTQGRCGFTFGAMASIGDTVLTGASRPDAENQLLVLITENVESGKIAEHPFRTYPALHADGTGATGGIMKIVAVNGRFAVLWWERGADGVSSQHGGLTFFRMDGTEEETVEPPTFMEAVEGHADGFAFVSRDDFLSLTFELRTEGMEDVASVVVKEGVNLYWMAPPTVAVSGTDRYAVSWTERRQDGGRSSHAAFIACE